MTLTEKPISANLAHIIFITLFVLAFCLISALPANALGTGEMFNQAYDHFHALRTDPVKSKLRAEWQKVERDFNEVLKRNPEGSYAPKALYYIGRTNEELGVNSGRTQDFGTAVDYYGRVVIRFPDHPWTDDCLYRMADLRIKRLNQASKGYEDLRTIVKSYPKSDMYPQAKARLEAMDDGAIASNGAGTGNNHEAEPASQPRPKPTGEMSRLDMIRYRSSDEYTRVVLELDHETPYVYKFLDPIPEMNKPHRVYIDLQDTVINPEVDTNVEISDGILSGYRAAQNNSKTTRVVLDLLEYQEHKVFHLNNPFRIIVDVHSPAGVQASTVQASPAPKPSGEVQVPENVDAGDLVEVLGLTVKTIMIDPGHGGKDKGAVHNGIMEKDVNLKVAAELGELLRQQGFKVLFTRTTDVFVPLDERTAMANEKMADLFISIHCNAINSKKVNGFEIYTLNLKSSNENAKRVAARENGVDPNQISDLDMILSDLIRNSKIKESTELAELVQEKTVSEVRKTWSVNDHGHREAPFYVLMGAKMPAVLIELGYLTNANEAERLRKSSYQRAMAKGILNGILAYKEKIESFAMR